MNFLLAEGVQQFIAFSEINRTPIVRVYQTEVPQFRPLIEVGHSRRGNLEQDLRQGIESTIIGYLLLKQQEVLEELVSLGAFQDGFQKHDEGTLVPGIR